MNASGMRVCVVYDCLFPHTVGGAERWYRNLAERLAPDGHEVTYLTLRQWERGERRADRRARAGRDRGAADGALHRRRAPAHPAAARVRAGRARAPAAHGRRYDVVHTCVVPLLLAARRRARCGRSCGFGLVVDWFEVWSRSYWRDYLGGAGGRVGALVQRAVRARAPARVLLLRAARRSACARRACAAR